MLNPIFAISGAAEAPFVVVLLGAWCGVVAMSVSSGFAYAIRSRAAAVVSALLVLATAVIFHPWTSLVALRPDPERDPDLQHWAAHFRLYAVVWFLVAAVALASVAFVFLWGDRREAPPKHHGQAPVDAHPAGGDVKGG